MNKTFSRSDYVEAVKKIRTLDIAAIDEVIDSSIPLDVNEYALPNFRKTNLLGMLMQTTSWEFGYGAHKGYKKKTYEEYLANVEKAICHIINRVDIISVTFGFLSDLIQKSFSNAFILLLEKGIDINLKDDVTGKTLKELLAEKPLPEVDEYLKNRQPQVAESSVEIKNPDELSELTLGKLRKLLHKYLVGLKTDVEFLLENTQDASTSTYNNKKSLDKFREAYDKIVWKGYVSDETKDATFSLLLEDLENEKQKGKLPEDRLVENAYRMLHKVKIDVPFKFLNEMVQSGTITSREQAINAEKEWWETENEGQDIRIFTIDFTKKEDIEKVLKHLLDRFNDYLLYWRYTDGFNTLVFIDTSAPEKPMFVGGEVTYKRKNDDEFYGAALSYPEFEPLITAYARKIVQHNQDNGIIYQNSDRYARPKGAEALAASVFLNEENEKLMLDYLAPLPPDCLDRTFFSVFTAIRRVWKTGGRLPHLPKVFEQYPELGQQLK